jgi:DNA-directed RNA polymerase specialized sigma24 family protein
MRRSPRHRVSLDELEALYRERLDAFCSVAASITGDRDAARDVVHTAFASAVQEASRFQARVAPRDVGLEASRERGA